MKKRTRILSFLLSIITILEIAITPAYASDAGGVGTGGTGSAGGSKGGTFTQAHCGYRMYIIDDNGKRVSNKVDILFSSYPNGAGAAWNDRFEPFNTKEECDIVYADKLIGVKSSIPMPMIKASSGYTPQGEQFRQWMLDGKACIQPTYSSGSGGSSSGSRPITYKRKPSSSGGTSSGGTSGSGNSGSTTKPSDNQSPTATSDDLSQAVKQLIFTMLNSFKIAWSYKGASKANAIYIAVRDGKGKIDELKSTYTFTPAQLNTLKSIPGQVESGLRQNIDGGIGPNHPARKERITVTIGGHKYSVSNYKNNDSVIETLNNININNGLFEIAYATEAEDYKKATDPQNIEALLDKNNLFEITDSSVKKEKTILATLCNNGLKLIVEPVFWWVPEKQVQNSAGEWVRGSSIGYTFYGTLNGYGKLMAANAAAGKWTDGGKGGWYGTTMHHTGANSLFLDSPLKIHEKSGAAEILIDKTSELTGKSKLTNDQLAQKSPGHTMHYYFGPPVEGDPDLPETSTYDDVPEGDTYPSSNPKPNPTPHQPIDPDPKRPSPKIPLLPNEPQEPGIPAPEDPRAPVPPEDEGYRNTTRNIHIVKVYEIEHIDGTIEHVTTNWRDDEPGTISIKHEPDYKVVEHFSSEKYYTYFISPLDETVDWKTIKEKIPATSDTDFTYEFSMVQDEKGGTPVPNSPVKLGVAADPEFDPDKDGWIREPHCYYDTTLYVRLIKKDKIPETSTTPMTHQEVRRHHLLQTQRILMSQTPRQTL